MKFRFHVPGIPHTVTNSDFIHCAFTQKVYKLCQMLTGLGHEVYHYGCEGSNPICTEHIDVIDNEFRKKYYPDEWHDKHWDFNTKDECYKLFFKNTTSEIKKRLGEKDFLLCSWGWGHKPIADGLGKSVMTVESGIGYKDTFCGFRVFESYNWMSYVYGKGHINEKGQHFSQDDGKHFDAVIPNYFDPDDFQFDPDNKEDWFLYLGRIVKRKGVEIAAAATSNLGGHLKIAGQGKFEIQPPKRGEIIENIGFADYDTRRELLSKAKALFVPTIYIEPFGGVSIEAMMSGTPVISSDWGVFNETVLHGLTGYRCRTLEQFCWAAKNINNISPQTCREWAMENFTIDKIGVMYQEYFEMLYSLWNKGWYEENPNRIEMSWLNKSFPQKVPISTGKKVDLPPVKLVQSIFPLEREPDYALDLTWYDKPKKPGISFILRAKNEEKTIGMALDSLKQLDFPYEINVVLNQCTDKTEEIVASRMLPDSSINMCYYPFQLGKTGLENQCTPVKSVHSTIWMLNWMLMKGNYQHTFRWDADFIMTSHLAHELKTAINDNEHDIYNISAAFSDNGKANVEPYLWDNNLKPRYVRYSLWHLAKFGNRHKSPGSLKGRIIHDSPLDELKDYWDANPWWEHISFTDVPEVAMKAKTQYADLKQKIGGELTTKGRASCPESEKLAEKVQKIVGADIAEIQELQSYTLTSVKGN